LAQGAEAHDDVGELVVRLLLLGEHERELVRADQAFGEDEIREAAADLRLALGGGGTVSGVTVAVRGRGDEGAGGRRFPGPLPVNGALETHSRETRLQSGNQSDQASHRIAISVTCVTPRPAARVIPGLAVDDPATRGQEMTPEMAGQLRLKVQCALELNELLAARRDAQ